MKEKPTDNAYIITKIHFFLCDHLTFYGHGHCQFKFLYWLEACLLLHIAKYDLVTILLPKFFKQLSDWSIQKKVIQW